MEDAQQEVDLREARQEVGEEVEQRIRPLVEQ